MGQVINDSAEVRQFARRVNDALREVRASRLALDNAFTEVRRSWRDARAEDAERRINLALVEMLAFERDAAVTEEWLQCLASRIDNYLRGGC